MEGLLKSYARPYDALWPVLCMDERPVQLVRETRTPAEATAAHPRRVDCEYERAGTELCLVPGGTGWSSGRYAR